MPPVMRSFCSAVIQMGHAHIFPMTTTSKLAAAAVVAIAMAASQADAGEGMSAGYRQAPPYGPRYAPRNYRGSYTERWYPPQRPDLGAAIAGALAGAALELIPRATAALVAKLPAEASAPPPPAIAAQLDASPPGSDALSDIEGNARGITRQEVEAALVDWCATHGNAPLCVKLRVAAPSPPPPAPAYAPPPAPNYAPPPQPYYRTYSDAGGRRYYRPGRYPTWNGCQHGWTVQDGLCKPYRGY
jgi:hypothetical protein